MNHKLKIALTTFIGLALASIAPISLINMSRSNNNIVILNSNTTTQNNDVQAISSIDNVEFTISGRSRSMFAVVKDEAKGDRLYAWGNNFLGEKLGLGDSADYVTVPTLVNIPGHNSETRITSVVEGGQNSAIVLNNEEVYVTGTNYSGQLANGEIWPEESVSTFIKVEKKWTGKIVQIVNGERHFMLLTDNGELWGWGNNHNGEIGTGDTSRNPYTTPVKVPNFGSGKIVDIHAGENITIVWKGSELYFFGANTYGTSGTSIAVKEIWSPKKVTLPSGTITQISLSSASLYVVLNNNTLYGVGANYRGNLGIGELQNSIDTFKKIASGNDMKVIDTNAEGVIISHSGRIFATGFNEYGQFGVGHSDNLVNFTQLVLPTSDISKINIKASWSSTYLFTDGKIYASGSNNYGQFGIGSLNGVFNRFTEIKPFGTPSKFTIKNTNTTIKPSIALPDIYSDGVFKIDGFKKYVDYIDNFPPDTKFTLKGTPVSNDETGSISLTLTASKWYSQQDGVMINSSKDFPIDINNFSTKIVRTEIKLKPSYNTSLTPTQVYEYLSKNASFAKLEEYVNFTNRPSNTSSELGVDLVGLTNAIDNINGNLSFNIVLKNYYDEYAILRNDFRHFSISLTGLLKDSSVTIKNDYSVAAELINVKSFQEQMMSHSVVDLKTALSPYINFNFAQQSNASIISKLDRIEFKNGIPEASDGKVTFTLTFSNYYEQGKNVPEKDFTLIGFKHFPHYLLSPKEDYNRAVFPQALFAYLQDDTANINLEKLREYVNLDGVPSDAIINIISSSINENNDGSLKLSLSTDKWYEYGYLNNTSKSFEVSFTDLIKNSSIEIVQKKYNISAKQALNAINVEDTVAKQMAIEQYLDMSLDSQTDMNWVDAEAYSETVGKLSINFSGLVNYYEDGIQRFEKTFVINDFIINTIITQKSDGILNDKTASEVIQDILVVGPNDLATLEKYAEIQGVPTDAKITITKAVANDAKGEVNFDILIDQYYENGELIIPETPKSFAGIKVQGFKLMVPKSSNEIDNNWWVYLLAIAGGALLITLISYGIYVHQKKNAKIDSISQMFNQPNIV